MSDNLEGQVTGFQGQVFVMAMDNALVVSWRNIEFGGTTHTINAQLTIYADTGLDLCWGEGSIAFPIRAGMWYVTPLADYKYPDMLPPFNLDGVLVQSEVRDDVGWPEDQCHYF